jgi:hypothetical protein
MAPGFGSGLAHALTAGLSGYAQGEDDQRKQLIVLAAQRRQEERQKQQDEIARIGALSQAAQAGLDVTPMTPSSPTSGPRSVPPVAVPDTASVRAVKGQNPTTPDGGETSPAIPSQDGTVLGSVGGMQIRVPQGGVVGKAARDDAAKQAQRTADLLKRAQPLNAKLPAGHPYKLSDGQLASIAADPGLYNEWAKGALGITQDPTAVHRANRLFDQAHPTRDAASSEPSWQILQTDEGTYERNPKTGQTRAVLDPNGQQIMPRAARGVLKQVAENTEQMQAIDTAIQQVQSRPSSVGPSRALLPDMLSQYTDKEGIGTRSAVANVGSLVVHDRSGATVTINENKRLNPFVPSVHDRPEAALIKLKQLRALLATETAALSGSVAQAGGSAHQAAPKQTTGGADVNALKAKYGLE